MSKKIDAQYIKDLANKLLVESFDNMTVESVEVDIKSLIEKQKRTFLMKVLGLEYGWGGEISIKHDGVFKNMIDRISKDDIRNTAKEIILKMFQEEELVLTEKEKSHLKNTYKREYLACLEEFAKEEAENKARQDIDSMVESFMEKV